LILAATATLETLFRVLLPAVRRVQAERVVSRGILRRQPETVRFHTVSNKRAMPDWPLRSRWLKVVGGLLLLFATALALLLALRWPYTPHHVISGLERAKVPMYT
jgi:hypothetical protein